MKRSVPSQEAAVHFLSILALLVAVDTSAQSTENPVPTGATTLPQQKTIQEPVGSQDISPAVSQLAATARAISNEQDPKERITRAYALGNDVINRMIGATTLITMVHELVYVEQSINEATSIWSDADIRNAWDNGRDVATTLAGFGALAGAVLVSLDRTNNLRDGTRVISAAGVSEIAGHLFGTRGKQNAARIREKLMLGEVSRRAYDGLLDRRSMVNGFYRSNVDFESRLGAFGKRYSDIAAGRTLATPGANAEPPITETEEQKLDSMRKGLVELEAYMGEFAGVMRQIPAIVDSYESLVDTYSRSGVPMQDGRPEVPIPQDVRAKMTSLRQPLEEIRQRFRRTEVQGLLNVSPDVVITIRQAIVADAARVGGSVGRK